ncbi:MAG: IS4 family transposase [Lentimicrobiaceae bacterium]|nr:IS4 family transposase [Lentimicrobiaceae bacterium]
MNSGKYVFAQVLSLVSRWEFDKCVAHYNGDFRTRELNCWNQFVQLFFGQLTSLNSLRDICLCLVAHQNKLYHLGIRQSVSQSTLSRANENRDWRIFADFGAYLISITRPLYADYQVPDVHTDSQVFALDSTTISLSIKLFTWAFGKYSRGAVKVHTLLDLPGNIPTFIHVSHGKWHDSNALDLIDFQRDAIYVMDRAYVDYAALFEIERAGAFFVTRAKKNMRFEVVETNYNIDPATGLRADCTIALSTAKSAKLYPLSMRMVDYHDDENDIDLRFITNNFELSALDVAHLYKHRWQIEVFFKWIKQNLTIKRLWGHSENAVHIHIWVAISTYLVVAYLKAQMHSELSIYEILQILSISAFDKTPIRELLTQPVSNQNVNEPLNLFNSNF